MNENNEDKLKVPVLIFFLLNIDSIDKYIYSILMFTDSTKT